MRSGTKVSLLSSFLVLSFAINNVQANYGNFPCGTNDGSSPVSGQVNAPDQEKCLNRPTVGSYSRCIPASNGVFACGIKGAACNADRDCDGGQCQSGICTGGPGFVPKTGQQCLGRLRNTNYDGANVGACGGPGAACAQRSTVIGEETLIEFIRNPDDSLCASNYCSPSTGLCGARPGAVGGSCNSNADCTSPSECGQDRTGNRFCGADGTNCFDFDAGGTLLPPVDSACASGYCNPNNFVCGQPPSVPSGRARQRRNQIALARNCPPPQEACSLIGSFGYECVDTQSNIERCGSCDGTDCTELPGVDRVNCSEGSCIILSCTDGHRYDKINDSCILAQQE